MTAVALVSATFGLAAFVRVASRATLSGRGRPRSEAGEGVISAAIAVLIMAAIGAAVFLVFSRITRDAGEGAEKAVKTITVSGAQTGGGGTPPTIP